MKLFADMHVHSKFSVDGTSTMEEYCLAAEKTCSRIICFTEHVDFNSMEKNLSIIKDNRTQCGTGDGSLSHLFLDKYKRLKI